MSLSVQSTSSVEDKILGKLARWLERLTGYQPSGLETLTAKIQKQPDVQRRRTVKLNRLGSRLHLKLRGTSMATMTLSAKRQVVLPADLCRQVALAPGAQVEVRLAADGHSILIAPVSPTIKKPASVLFSRATHSGKPVTIEEIQGSVSAARLAEWETRNRRS
jgi:bifunctional DNA-binding transcriptional regulator/antitoxin component of YhaV-PrlF toxin-antitoxin module